MKTVYYAHCIAIYGTPQEARDRELLEALGFAVCNPNSYEVATAVEELKAKGDPNYMDYFRQLVQAADAVAFRALPDGAIPAGIYKELGFAKEYGKPVFELPSNMLRREMSLEATRAYLHEVGQR